MSKSSANKNFKAQKKLTKTHSTESRLNDQHNNRNDITIDGQIENSKAKDEHESRLETHHEELSHDVSEEDFNSRYARHQAALQHALISLNQHRSRCQRDRQEENDAV